MAPRQESFTSGELNPRLHNKEGHPAFGTGAERLRNVLVTPEGDVVSRPGLEYLGQPVPGYGTDVVGFRYTRATGEHYAVFFTAGEVRVCDADGAVVLSLSSTPWTTSLERLRFLTSGDYLYVFHPSATPRRFVPYDGASTLEAIAYERPACILKDAAIPARLKDPLPTADPTHPARKWKWKVTVVGRYADGRFFETKAQDVTQLAVLNSSGLVVSTSAAPTEVALYPDQPVSLTWYSIFSYNGPEESVSVRVYRGDGIRYGLVGEADISDGSYSSFIDAGAEPDWTRPPPLGFNPLEVRDNTGAVVRTEEPVCGAFHEERLVLAGTEERPDWATFSVTGDYGNFDRTIPGTADMAFEAELPARTRERIRHALSVDRALLLFTDEQVWGVEAPEGQGVAFDAYATRERWAVGAGHAPPLRAGRHVLFETRAGRVCALLATGERGSYVDVDLTAFAEHLFDDAARASGLYLGGASPIVSMAFQSAPWPVLWVVLRDGRMASLTLDVERKVRAWCLHETQAVLGEDGLPDETQPPAGTIKAVVVLPGTQEDSVYVVVDRADGVGAPGGKRTLERMTGFRVPDGLEPMERPGLDCYTTVAVVADVPEAVPAHLVGWGGDGTDGVWPLTAMASGGLTTLEQAADFTLDTSYAEVHVGVPFVAEVATLRLRGAASQKVALGRLFVDVFMSRGLWYGPTLDTRARTLAALQEARARSVAASYDGPALETRRLELNPHTTWDGGARVTLQQRAPYPFVLTGLEREVRGGG